MATGKKPLIKKSARMNRPPSKGGTKGTFTRAAKKAGKTVQQEAASVLKPGSKASPAMKKKANFARNAAKWNH